jgi:hypothetical protein
MNALVESSVPLTQIWRSLRVADAIVQDTIRTCTVRLETAYPVHQDFIAVLSAALEVRFCCVPLTCYLCTRSDLDSVVCVLQHKVGSMSLASCVASISPKLSAACPSPQPSALPQHQTEARILRLRHRMCLDAPRSFLGACLDVLGSELLSLRHALANRGTNVVRCVGLIDGNVNAVLDAGSTFTRAMEPSQVFSTSAAMLKHAHSHNEAQAQCMSVIRSLGINLLLV